MPRYWLHGLVIDSEIELGPLAAASEPADISIRLGDVPATLAAGLVDHPTYCQTETETLIRIPMLGSILVGAGNRTIVARPEIGVDPVDLVPILLGPVWAALLHQRGDFPIAGALFTYRDLTVLLCGPSVVGVSSLAAMAQQLGAQVLSDESCLWRPGADETRVVPGVPALRVGHSVLAHLGVSADDLRPVRAGLRKFWLPVRPSDARSTTRVDALVELWNQHDPAAGSTFERVTGFGAFSIIDCHTLHRAYMRSTVPQSQQLARCAVVARHLPVFSFHFNRDMNLLRENSESLLRGVTSAL